MKNLITATLMLAVLPLFAADLSPVGSWVTYKNDDGVTQEGLVHVYEAKDEEGNLVYNGKVGKSLMKDSTSPKNCVNCPEPFTDKPIKGMQFLWGFVPDENNPGKFIDGHVLDPLTGNLYNANMTLSEDGNTLVFRGYMGISLFGSDRTWTRYVEPVKKKATKKKPAKKSA